MTGRRGRRRLSGEDQRLWDLVRESAKPLRAEPAAPPAVPEEAPAAPPVPAAATSPAAVQPRKPAPAPAATPSGIDRRTRSRLSRGSLDIDARLDLHGLTQAAAHQRLRRFLEDGQAAGARLVLVITGKGALGERTDYGAPERGVLRRAVPEWLRSPAFRGLVAGLDEAGRRHGGAGAIYVRVRRKRGEEGS